MDRHVKETLKEAEKALDEFKATSQKAKDISLQIQFGRDVFESDVKAVDEHGWPKFMSGKKVRVAGGQIFTVTTMVWADIFNTWVYRTPNGVFQSEVDLKEIK